MLPVYLPTSLSATALQLEDAFLDLYLFLFPFSHSPFTLKSSFSTLMCNSLLDSHIYQSSLMFINPIFKSPLLLKKRTKVDWLNYFIWGRYSVFSTWKVKEVLVAQLYPTLCDPMDCSPPGFPVHGILQARTLQWVALPFSRGSSWLRDGTHVSCIAGRFFTVSATRR